MQASQRLSQLSYGQGTLDNADAWWPQEAIEAGVTPLSSKRRLYGPFIAFGAGLSFWAAIGFAISSLV